MIYDATTRIAEVALRMRARLGGSAALRERLLCGTRPAPARVWVHAASVGELTSARVVIEALAARGALQITTNSETGRALARDWGLAARLAPLDLPGTLARFLDALRPDLAVTVEGEFWPLRSRLLAERGIAQAMIGARMSERSAATWSRFPRVIAPMLGRIDALSAQDQGSEARLLTLGLPPRALMARLDLKLLAPAALPVPPEGTARDRTILAASTHAGEDEPVLDAFAQARAARPALALILAPRHPDRAKSVAGLIAARGLPMARRSAGADAPPPGGVLLADSLGEMARWYARSGICIVGGSLVDHGGHTPWEPAAHGCALIHGPHVGNFVEAFDALDAAGAARMAGGPPGDGQAAGGDRAAIAPGRWDQAAIAAAGAGAVAGPAAGPAGQPSDHPVGHSTDHPTDHPVGRSSGRPAGGPAGDLAVILARLVDRPAQARAMGRSARALLEARAGDPGGLIARLDDLASRRA